MEQLWSPIMTQVEGYFSVADVKTANADAFPLLSTSNDSVDVLILNYMLSDMRKFRAADYQLFLINLLNLIQQKQPRFILINDIYLKVSLGASTELLSYLAASGIQYRFYACQYHTLNTLIGTYGEIIPKQGFTMTDAEIVGKYNPFREVNSIQTIIRFQ
jgi:hypothetical protein